MRRLAGLFQRWDTDEKLRYLAIGAWNTLFGYLCFLFLYLLLRRHLHYLVIGVMSHVAAVINAFACHRLLVFRSRGPLVGEFIRFTLTHSMSLLIGLAGLWSLVDLGHLDPLASQALLTIAITLFGYLAHRRFTFAAR